MSLQYKQVRTLLKKHALVKRTDCKDDYKIISLKHCIFDAVHKQVSIVCHPNGQTISYVCHSASCKERTWEQALARLKGKSLDGIQELSSAQLQVTTEQTTESILRPMFMKISKLKINPRNAILPLLTQEQFGGLKDQIQRYGFRDPIEITPDNTILDGHNRATIAEAIGIVEVPVIVVDIAAEQQERYIIEKNLHRRQLTPEQQSYLRGRVYQYEKRSCSGAPLNNQNASQNNGDILTPLNTDKNRTRDKVAKQFGVSPKTIQRDAAFSTAIDTIKEVDSDTAQKILAKEKIKGQKPLTKRDAIQAAKKIAEKKTNEEPIPNTEEILKLVEEEKQKENLSSNENISQEGNTLETDIPKGCILSLASLLDEILDRVQMLKSHQDFPYEAAGQKIEHVEQELISIMNIVSENGEKPLEANLSNSTKLVNG